ncbi:MAG: hypothetical protein IJV03_03665 [Alphaproteobacteria bacterium]|nr:hypothetical protein [Alphaproteobacteria bacterium]
MKKSVIALALVGVMPMLAANGAGYRSTSSAGVKTTTYKAKKSGGYKNTITNNFYYNANPSRQVSYQGYNEDSYARPTRVKVADKTTTTRRSVKSQERKFFLAHPFFQPLKGKFGSVTDVSFARSTMNLTLLNANIKDLDATSSTVGNVAKGLGFDTELKAKEITTQFAVKEDISYGLTDKLALMLMAQYDKTDMEVKDWSDGSASTKTSESGLNIFGIGLQGRFLDTPEYIGMLSGYFQHQKDAANTLMAELKMGTKIDRFTLYGLARASYSKLDNKGAYGAYMKEDNGDWLMLSYQLNTDNVFQAEGGIGAFAVFNKYLTGKAELTYGSYDWHEQMNLRGEIGFQPGDSFAINLYASAALYDSAKGKTKTYMNYDINPEAVPDTSGLPTDQQISSTSKLLYTYGDYKINKYNEYKIGIQGILYF